MISSKQESYSGHRRGGRIQKAGENMAQRFYLSHLRYKSYLSIKSPKNFDGILCESVYGYKQSK